MFGERNKCLFDHVRHDQQDAALIAVHGCRFEDKPEIVRDYERILRYLPQIFFLWSGTELSSFNPEVLCSRASSAPGCTVAPIRELTEGSITRKTTSPKRKPNGAKRGELRRTIVDFAYSVAALSSLETNAG